MNKLLEMKVEFQFELRVDALLSEDRTEPQRGHSQ
jgi:hypothetical protein